MAQEGGWTRAKTICTRLKHNDQVAYVRLRQFQFVRQQVKWRAQWPDDRSDLAFCPSNPITDNDGIVLANDLAEVPRGGKMMVHAAIGYEKQLSARYFAIEDTANVNARFSHDVTAELDDDARAWQPRTRFGYVVSQSLADRGNV